MQSKENKDWTGMSEQLFEHGIRNTHIMCEAPYPMPQPILNETSGIEPWMLDMVKIEKSPDILEREFASCIVTPGGDDIDMLIASRIKMLDTMMEAGLEGAIIRPDMGYGHTRFNDMSKSQNIYALKNLYYGAGINTQLIEKEDNTKKPPKGRSQKAHNLIQQMNKRKR